MRTGPFSLVKWYLDCITDAGHAVIVYCAEMRWRGLRTRMASVLESPPGAAPVTHSSIGAYRLNASKDEIAVEHRRFGVRGTWRPAAPGFERTVYANERGSVIWNCLQPGSRVSCRIGERELNGLGYGERLTLTVPPWRLPLSQLRWGRFVSEKHSIIWIDWRGEHSTKIALCDGRPCDLLSASENEIVTSDGTLRILPGVSLRSGRLKDTIVPGMPGLAKLIPGSLFNIHEQKWKSRGTLQTPAEECSGWVIHEVVDWIR